MNDVKFGPLLKSDKEMPSPKYGSVDEMVRTLPREELVIVNRLRALVRDCLPKSTELGYYGLAIPFYRHNRLICFIWPSSIVWGSKQSGQAKKKKGIVTLGFNQGYLMSNEDGALLAEGRKQVYILYIKSLKEMDEGMIRALLFEAGMIDEGFTKKTVRKGK